MSQRGTFFGGDEGTFQRFPAGGVRGIVPPNEARVRTLTLRKQHPSPPRVGGVRGVEKERLLYCPCHIIDSSGRTKKKKVHLRYIKQIEKCQ